MSQETNLNVSPYFDDFDVTKNYHRVLAKPEYPVQAREINNLQSILQNQIEQFGNHFFKEGSKVIPGQTGYNRFYNAVEIENSFSGVTLDTYLSFLVGKIIVGETSGIQAKVDKVITSEESIRGSTTLYVNYLSVSPEDNTRSTFIDGENLLTTESFITSNLSFDVNQAVAKTIPLNCNSIASLFTLSEGIYYLRGHFVNVDTQDLILDQYSNNPSYKIGFTIFEEILTADIDETLTDNAQGFNNYAAPGADRLKITAVLDKKSLDDTTSDNFIQIAQIQDGIIRNTPNDPIYNIIEDKFAKRTYDESGDYYVKRFDVACIESLNDSEGNNGAFFEGFRTYQGNTPSDDLAIYKISPGKAYVRGYEVQVNSPTFLDVEKPRTTANTGKQSLIYSTGSTLSLNRVSGSPQIGIGNTYTISLRDSRVGFATTSVSGTEIGVARVYDFALEEGGYQANLNTNVWDITLYDLQLYTFITLNQPITLTTPAYFVGNSSGATGYLKNNVSNSSSIILYNVSGKFIKNESFTINNIRNSRIGTAVTSFDVSNVKSVYGSSTYGPFNSDTIQSNSLSFGNCSISLEVSGISTITIPGLQYVNSIKQKDILSYTNFSQSALPIYVTVNSVTTNEQSTLVNVSGVTTVSGVCDGKLPTTTTTLTDLKLLKTQLSNSGNSELYTPLSKKNVSIVNLEEANLVIRKQFNVNITSNSTDVVTVGSDYSFMPYDEERYSLIRSDGITETLSSDRISISSDGKQLQVNGLGSDDTNATLITTIRKINVTAKTKLKNRVNSITIDKSSLPSSGIGTTTRNDNLVYDNYPYGTRVQDKEISLNVPDVIVVHGVFEAQNLTEPAAPSLTISNLSPVNNTSTIIVGERFVGQTSGAVAICVEIVNTNIIRFIYKNQTSFQIGEVIVFKESQTSGFVNQLNATSKDISSSYNFDNGQRESYYDYSRIIRKEGSLEPQSKIKVYFDNAYYTDQDKGDITTASSYASFDYTRDIQSINAMRNTDIIDLRPRVDTYTISTGKKSPFEFEGRSFSLTSNSSAEILASDEELILDFDYYQPRIDRIFVDRGGIFTIQKGVPSDNPTLPQPIEDAIEVARINLPAYLYNTNQADITQFDYKRYQMNDISSLEDRIKNLESYTTLNLLEKETANLFISDNADPGLNRFKSGFLVDNFKSIIPQDQSVGIRNSIDAVKGELRPSHYTTSIDLIVGTNQILGDGNTLSIDYKNLQTSDILGSNIQKTGDVITLNYDHKVFLDQPFATRSENIQPFILNLWQGTIKLNPPSDVWVDVGRTTIKTINKEGNYLEKAKEVGANPQNGLGPVLWGLWTFAGYGGTFGVRSGRNQWEMMEYVNVNYSRAGYQTVVSEKFDKSTISKVVDSIEIQPNLRSRNVEFSCSGFSRGAKLYAFFDNIDVTKYCYPKLLEVSMTYGTFTVGERVRIEAKTGNTNTITGYFRLAKTNHKDGTYNNPSKIYTKEPYSNTLLPEVYTSASNILNIDTSSLSLKSDGKYYGIVQNGYELIGESSGAKAKVSNLRLITDDNGEIIGSFFIPDPKVPENPIFKNGTKTFKLTSDPTNNLPIAGGDPLSQAESNFFAEGKTEHMLETVLSVRNATVSTRVLTETTSTSVFTGVYYDPLAQSFSCDEASGVYLTKVDVFFDTKDAIIPVRCQIRTMELGLPTQTILPFSEVVLTPDQVNTSNDASVATTFTFESPVYIEYNKEYALVLISNSLSYRVWISRLGEKDRITGKAVETQPTLGSLFKSQNASTWTPSQFEDLKFKLYRAEFSTEPGYINFYNPDLSEGNSQIPTLVNNSLNTISKRIRVGLSNTITESELDFRIGTTVIQPNTNATGTYVSKVGIATGDTGNGGLVITSAGIGYTPSSGSLTYNSIPLVNITGTGRNATANITINNGVAVAATIANSGTGYQIGDVLTVSKLGNTNLGINLQISIANVNQFNELILDNVQGNFATGVGNSLAFYNPVGVVSFLNSGTGGNVLINPPVQVENDGLHFIVRHNNHGMHSASNYVTLKDVKTDTNPVKLTTAISNTSTDSIALSSSTILENFENYPVSINNPGYVIINNEIIKYTTVSSGVIGGITRGIDNTIPTSHDANSDVFKYEISGISLFRINRTHRLEDATIEKSIGLDYYALRVSQDAETVGNKQIIDRSGNVLLPALFFNSTKSGGGDSIKATQNMPFELVTPIVESFVLNNTSLTAQIRTVSGKSISGSEVSFIDQGYTPITLFNYNYFDTPRIICSKINETNNLTSLPGKKSCNLLLTLDSSDPRISPLIDLTRVSLITTSNRINKAVSDNDYPTDNRVNSLTRDLNAFIYVTKPFKLEIPASSLKLYVTADINVYSDIRALYCIESEISNEPIFELFPGYKNIDSLGNTIDISKSNGRPDKLITNNNNLSFESSDFQDYEFTVNNLPPFKYYRIKLIMTSTNQCYVPKLKDIRSIALA